MISNISYVFTGRYFLKSPLFRNNYSQWTTMKSIRGRRVDFGSDALGGIPFRTNAGGKGIPPPPPENVSKRMKLYKKLFSTVLFGGTLALAIYLRRKRSAELRDLLTDARRLPIDYNYESAAAQHMYVYRGFVLHLDHLKALQSMAHSFKAKYDDVYVVSFPKSGTTWVQEIVYLLGNNLNYEKAAAQIMESRFPYLEYVYPGWQSIEKLAGTRYIKSHLPYSLLPSDIIEKNCKIIYVVRNPKDVLVSYYFYARMLTFATYRGSLKEFFESFLRNERKRLADHIWTDFITGKCLSQEDLQALAEHVSFERMAANPTVNYSHWDDLGLRHKEEARFLRQGKVGDWKNYLTEEMDTRINNWIKQNTQECDLKFDYE